MPGLTPTRVRLTLSQSCPPQMERETFLSQVDLEAPFQADLELEAEVESNNNVRNEPNENDSEPEKVHSIACLFPTSELI